MTIGFVIPGLAIKIHCFSVGCFALAMRPVFRYLRGRKFLSFLSRAERGCDIDGFPVLVAHGACVHTAVSGGSDVAGFMAGCGLDRNDLPKMVIWGFVLSRS